MVGAVPSLPSPRNAPKVGNITLTSTPFAGKHTLSTNTRGGAFSVNPRNYSAQGIAEMDTGDALGDFYFAGRSVCAPMECATDPKSHDCTNPEVTHQSA